MEAKIAYIMSRFPHLPETFILREMKELIRLKWNIVIYPLIFQKNEAVIHPEVKPLLSLVRCLPFISPAVLMVNLKKFLSHPIKYCSLFMQVLWGNRSPSGFLIRSIILFPKAVYTADLMKKEGITHIHAHYATHPALMAWLIHRFVNISYSITVHAHDIFVVKSMLAKKLKGANFIVAISNYNREYLATILGNWVYAKTHIIHCGIEPENYNRAACDLKGKSVFKIINVGSLELYKGQSFLIKACAKLLEMGIPAHCCIIGGGVERNNIERLIKELNIKPHVELLGPLPQDEVARILKTASCYVQPSIITPTKKMEGIPVALMEALACSLPVVATRISGIPEIIRHNETGYLVNPGDVSALAEALANIYNNPKAAKQLTRRGYDLVKKEFDLKSNVALLADQFKKILTDNLY